MRRWALLLLPLSALGCKEKRFELHIASPCLMAPAIRPIARDYDEAHPRVTVSVTVREQTKLLEEVESGALKPDLLLCVGDAEAERLEKRGLVDYHDDFCFATLALVAASGREVRGVRDLAQPSIKSVGLAPSQTSMGREAERVLREEKVWAKVEKKLRRVKEPLYLLHLVKSGKLDAALAPAPCLMAEAKKFSQVRTVRIFHPHKPCVLIPCGALVLKGAGNPSLAKDFISFLITDEAQRALKRGGFIPLEEAVCW